MNDATDFPLGDSRRLDEADRLMLESLARADAAVPGVAVDGVRDRLMQRVAQSVRAASAFHTVRGPAEWQHDDGVRVRWLYRAAQQPLRAGEPLRVREIELPADGCHAWPLDAESQRCEWLVMAGDVAIDGVALEARDYHAVRMGSCRSALLRSRQGGRVLLREARDDGSPASAITVRDREAPWMSIAKHIERRVLAQWGREAALLYRVQPGASVPHHGHGHDEECLMLEGEAFIDDVLLRSGDYQLAPAGTHHTGVISDTGGILFAHGDIELAITGR
jgi:quercetin dioxygenase-like cupin family protein